MRLDVRAFIPHIGTDAPQSMLYKLHRGYMYGACQHLWVHSITVMACSKKKDKVSDLGGAFSSLIARHASKRAGCLMK